MHFLLVGNKAHTDKWRKDLAAEGMECYVRNTAFDAIRYLEERRDNLQHMRIVAEEYLSNSPAPHSLSQSDYPLMEELRKVDWHSRGLEVIERARKMGMASDIPAYLVADNPNKQVRTIGPDFSDEQANQVSEGGKTGPIMVPVKEWPPKWKFEGYEAKHITVCTSDTLLEKIIPPLMPFYVSTESAQRLANLKIQS